LDDTGPQFTVKLARTPEELRAAQALRYEVFVRELGGGGALVDHAAGLEIDRFDPYFDHLLLRDETRDRVVGVYRLLRCDQARAAGQFYSETEYDLAPLKRSGRRLLELGRSCLAKDYRGGMAIYHLWHGLSDYVTEHEIEILFGVASFHGTDIGVLAPALSLLHHNHLAPEDLRVTALPECHQRMDLVPLDMLDRAAAMVQVPALIKAYLRLGGHVGQGAYIDRDFNTTDVCLVLDTSRMTERQRGIYAGMRRG